jgi:hypothetical protein
MKHYSYPSIPQLNILLSDIRHHTRYVGQNPDTGKAMYDNNKPLPKVMLEGTVKINGANCSVVLDKEGNCYPQSREIVLTEEDTCYGFYHWFQEHKEVLRERLDKYLRGTRDGVKAVVVYGEWCGEEIAGKVAVRQLSKRWVVFDVRHIDETYENGGTGFLDCDLSELLHLPEIDMYDIKTFGTYHIEVDVGNAVMIQNQLVEYTQKVEEECPVGKYFGVNGTGEGLVWSIMYGGKKLRMKVKGAKHSSTKVKVLAPVDMQKVNSVNEFIEYAFTDNRMEQGINWMRQHNISISVENTGKFLAWVFKDVLKEETATMEKNGLTTKDIQYRGNLVVREYYMKQIGEY